MALFSANIATCSLCGRDSPYISEELKVCLSCIKGYPDKVIPIVLDAHRRSRAAFGLPPTPPDAKDGISCKICVNKCRIPDGGIGYCGLRRNIGGRLKGATAKEGKFSWYHDPLPTNCVADWVCAGGTGAGYPKYAYKKGPEYGYKNLAVFFHACSFDCLYCQNWHYRNETLKPETYSPDSLVSHVDDSTSCICYFGGDPTPQLLFAIKASKLAIERAKGKILRICWETNGSMDRTFLKKMMRLSLDTGGTIKFEFKAWNEVLHIALTGVTNKRTIENFEFASKMLEERKVPPPLVTSTLLVPGYIDPEEIRNIAKFIASIDPEIPYSLLAFYPHFYMDDMPLTSKDMAEECLMEAKKAGLKNVKIGNIHLLV